MSDEDELPAWSEPFAGSDHGRLTRGIAVGALDRDWAWGGSTGAGVTVAIIDSGLEVSHPALQGRVVQSVAVEMVDGEPKVVPDDGADLFGHATACGGIILGLAPQAELVSIRVLGADLRGTNLNGARLDGADLTDAHVDSTTVWPEGFKPT